MSIALSVVVRPSRRLRGVLAVYGASHGALALALAGGVIAPVAAAEWGAAACAITAGLAGWQACQIGTAERIDVSGTGAVRVTVQQQTGDLPTQLVQLLPGSTLWSQLMCLRLRYPDGRQRLLLVAPDSVERDAFRALSVALRSIAERDNIFFGKNKIV